MESEDQQLAENDNDLKPCTTDDCGYPEISLVDMPVEIILKICSFLGPVFLQNTLARVCQRLEYILSDETLWKSWIHSTVMGGCFPPIQQLKIWDEIPTNWTEISYEMDFEYIRWSDVKSNMKHVIVKDMHYASVDTLLLVNKGELCISGSRDRSMALMSVSDVVQTVGDDSHRIFSEAKPLKLRTDAHTGWVWDLAPDYIDSATTVYSASWDNSVKAWDLETFECSQKFVCGMSVLSLVGDGKEVVAGLYAKRVHIFDQRSGLTAVQTYKAHRGAVLDLCKSDKFIASISDDKTMTIYDRVAGRIIKRNIYIPNKYAGEIKAYPECISWSSSALYVGDSMGHLNLFNPENQAFRGAVEIWEQPPITSPQIKTKCVYQNEGTMIVCSDRGEIKFCYNCYPPTEFASMGSSTIDITELCYQSGTLAISTCDSALEFWVPCNKYS